MLLHQMYIYIFIYTYIWCAPECIPFIFLYFFCVIYLQTLFKLNNLSTWKRCISMTLSVDAHSLVWMWIVRNGIGLKSESESRLRSIMVGSVRSKHGNSQFMSSWYPKISDLPKVRTIRLKATELRYLIRYRAMWII